MDQPAGTHAAIHDQRVEVVLDLPPETFDGSGVSELEGFFEFELLGEGEKLHTHDPLPFTGDVEGLPVAEGDLYRAKDCVPVLREDESAAGELCGGFLRRGLEGIASSRSSASALPHAVS